MFLWWVYSVPSLLKWLAIRTCTAAFEQYICIFWLQKYYMCIIQYLKNLKGVQSRKLSSIQRQPLLLRYLEENAFSDISISVFYPDFIKSPIVIFFITTQRGYFLLLPLLFCLWVCSCIAHLEYNTVGPWTMRGLGALTPKLSKICI